MGIEESLKAMAHPARRRLLQLVRDDERRVGELAEAADLTQPGTSQHLRVLRDAGLVHVRVEGNRRWYRADADALSEVREALDEFWSGRLAELGRLAEQRARSHARGERSA